MRSLKKLVIGAAFVMAPAVAVVLLPGGTTGLGNVGVVHAAISNYIYLSDKVTDGMTARHYRVAKKKGGGNARSIIQQPQDNDQVRGTSGLKLGDTRGGSQAGAKGVNGGEIGIPGLKLPDTD
jgi:hypothetical protein